MTTRQTIILEALSEKQKIEVSTLATLLNVSQVTVRKDLDQLEESGLIRREHGFAVISSSEDISNRLAYHYDIKLKIACAAAETIQHGDTVMIENGSCCTILADELVKNKRDVTIITNSAFIANYIRKSPGAKIVLLGGDYQNEAQVMVGPIMKKCVESFFVDKLFIGTDGYTEKSGFTGNDYMRAESVRNMATQASKVVILTESQKFTQHSVVKLLPTEQVSMVYTDDKISPQSEKSLLSYNIVVKKVKSSNF